VAPELCDWDEKRLYLDGLRRLSRQEYFSKALLQRWERLGADRDVAAAVIQRLQHDGYQSDQRCIETQARCAVSRTWGWKKFEAKLRTLGVAEEQIISIAKPAWLEAQSACVRSALHDADANGLLQADQDTVAHSLDVDYCRVVWLKKFGVYPVDLHERHRQQAYLMRRGFSGTTVQLLFGLLRPSMC
jgi:SOS response regulatory protein OraA/RecX